MVQFATSLLEIIKHYLLMFCDTAVVCRDKGSDKICRHIAVGFQSVCFTVPRFTAVLTNCARSCLTVPRFTAVQTNCARSCLTVPRFTAVQTNCARSCFTVPRSTAVRTNCARSCHLFCAMNLLCSGKS